ncbi:DUF995 domain-containing protein [Leisingera sp. S132]|uniref:DUF995 domain-containing protein n=1 Tax=Leisingera sp. S132 TaxID=2867016 RepID=UPI0021A6F43C|nr:DUF995 domain-containing protein [Leisingera sp. S132]UWQ78058.1 DUF995 domain-containing protein [Leisingera sp. S132]
MGFRFGIASVLAAVFLMPAGADPARADFQFGSHVPKDATTPEPADLYRMFAGQTEDWGSGSYAYWAPDGTFWAVNEADQSVGRGRWHVTTLSRMCYEGTWAWRQDFGIETRRARNCSFYRRDAAGEMWSTTGSMADPWFPFSGASLSAGNTVAARYSALLATLGISELRLLD